MLTLYLVKKELLEIFNHGGVRKVRMASYDGLENKLALSQKSMCVYCYEFCDSIIILFGVLEVKTGIASLIL